MSLILHRRAGETIVIGGCIHIKILNLVGTQVAVAIDAPTTIAVDRLEVHLKKQVANNQGKK